MVSSMQSVQNTLTSIQNDTAKVNAQTNASSVGTSNLDQNSFLQLLISQLKDQDPENPSDPTQMVQEEAQLTQVDTMQQLSSSLTSSNSILEASSLIGKTVSLTDPNDSKSTITGTVSSATLSSSGANVLINNTAYPVSSITNIQ